nr:hypothetical protein [uncultured Carboxylicivirga sp.]
MKRLLSILLISIVVLSLKAQDTNEVKTLFGGNKDQSNGGYGAVMIGYSQIWDRDAILIGGRGGWIINHNFALGMGGYGFMTDPKTDPFIMDATTNLNSKYQITGGYGGLLFEPILGAKKPVHLSFPILIGAGGIAYTKHWENNDYNNDYREIYEDSDAFFVLEPTIELEFNMLKFFRLAFSASYRYTSNINLSYQDYRDPKPDPNVIGTQDMLRGMNYGITLKFGKF